MTKADVAATRNEPGTLGSIIHDMRLLSGMWKLDANEMFVAHKAADFLEELQNLRGADYRLPARVTPEATENAASEAAK